LLHLQDAKRANAHFATWQKKVSQQAIENGHIATEPIISQFNSDVGDFETSRHKMSSNDEGSNNKSSKLGRKGDPRMHKAVTARLENPNLTLYEALRIGGFNYPDNDDASLIDSEKVTLGQRKNQLSRRLRLARKQNGGDDSSLSGGFWLNGGQSQKTNPQYSLGARALQMKRDADLALDESDFVPVDAGNSVNNMMMEDQFKRPRMAKNHPDFAPLIVPPASFRASGSFDARSHSTQPSSGHAFQGDNKFGPAGNIAGPTGGSGLASGPFFNPLFTNAYSGQHHQPRASAVAVSSLTSTAQAVGLTLEQLALALSSNTTNLAKLVAETKSGESMSKQQDLALSLFETESKALYTKCMLMSGIDMSLAQPGTPTYMAFALKAWQAEGKRLQDMMSSARRESASDLSIGEGGAGADDEEVGDDDDEENEDCSHQSHEHEDLRHAENHRRDRGSIRNENDHDNSNCDAQHVHRLGQCGHKAIIHQPKDGAAHIDFIVNDQVECYMGLDSVPFGRNIDSIWPSKYKCKDVEEPYLKTCLKTLGKNVLGAINTSEAGCSVPKILKLSEINLQDPEWNFDGGDSVDGGVMGLFKLGGDGSS
jgi:hypothetical protein